MSKTHVRGLFAITAVLLGLAHTGDGATYLYNGTFTDVHVSADECSDIFVEDSYTTKLFLFSGRKIVLAWTHVDSAGFLHGRSVLGYLGGGNEFVAERTTSAAPNKLKLKAGGMVEEHAIYLRLLAQRQRHDGSLLCEAWADYLGSAY